MQYILKYFPDLTEEKKEKFTKLNSLYNYWNERINLISRKDIGELYLKHVLHSLSIAKFIQFRAGTKIMDVGTGGGFPGIPLAIYFPDCEFLLVDSIEKKVKVVQDIIEKLELGNCSAMVARAEKINKKFDYIVSRAVAPLPKFYGWVKSNLSNKPGNLLPNGIIYLKGGELDEELEPFEDWYTLTNISKYFEEDFFETKKIIHLFK